MAVPLDRTATRFALLVYKYAELGFFSTSRTTSPTPGVYVLMRSSLFSHGLEGTVSIFPGVGY